MVFRGKVTRLRMKTGYDRLTYDDALSLLVERINYERTSGVTYGEREYKLDRMRELLDRLGNPQLASPVLHVAGTKGKGSTAAMLAAVLSAAGYKTGLYTSPHLHHVGERMAVDGRACSSSEFIRLVEHIEPVVQAMDAAASRAAGEVGPTYFELTTALAMLHFARQQAQVSVLEVGMGGRLDSTNVCQPLVSIITSISFDHTRQLGNTLALIAREKAGIIKPGVPVVSGVSDDEPRAVIEAVAAENSSRLVQTGRDFDFTYRPPAGLDHLPSCGSFDFDHRDGRMEHIELELLGRHQAANASVALAALWELTPHGFEIGEHALRSGLARVRWPARIEVISRRPTVILDASHNVASVQALVDTIAESFASTRRVLLFAGTQEKDTAGMLRLLLPAFERVIFTRYLNNPRSVPPDELHAIATDLGRGDATIAVDPASAWKLARADLRPEDLCCITGSFFIAAETQREMLNEAAAAGKR